MRNTGARIGGYGDTPKQTYTAKNAYVATSVLINKPQSTPVVVRFIRPASMHFHRTPLPWHKFEFT